MNKLLTFSFELSKEKLRHIKEKSFYNNNFYEIDLYAYGDLIIPEKCNVLYEKCEDDCSEAYYSLGYFENNKFVAMFTWLDDEKEL